MPTRSPGSRAGEIPNVHTNTTVPTVKKRWWHGQIEQQRITFLYDKKLNFIRIKADGDVNRASVLARTDQNARITWVII